jgi:hypothetical protein
MFQVTKTFTFKNGNSSEHVWDLVFSRKETYLPSLPAEITTVDQLLSKVKALSLSQANSGKLLSKFTELYNGSESIIKLNFLDEVSWNEYVALFKTELGYDPATALDIADCVTEVIEFASDLVPNELTVYTPTL